MAKLTDAEIEAAVALLPGWERDGITMRRSFTWGSFPLAIAFVVEVGFLAEAADHHPDLDIRWRTVHVALTSHDVGALTKRDFKLAAAINGLVSA
jgi:4a-hydroxytetrahydrobiopterin dehydratase